MDRSWILTGSTRGNSAGVGVGRIEPVRADALVTRGSILKATLEAILHSDFMVADVTGANPNVLYELGIRHALAPHATLIVASTDTSMPLILSTEGRRYETSDAGPGNASVFVEQLREVLERQIQGPFVDSPVYDYIPDLQVAVGRSREDTSENSLRWKRASASALSKPDGSAGGLYAAPRHRA